MKKIIGIYKITSPSGKVYIGQSIDIEKRFNIYRFLSCKSQKKLYASFLRYGVENHTFEIIMECKKNELNYYERHYQEYYNVLDEYGLNLKYTQVAEKKQVYSEETRKKLSQNHVSKKEGYVNHMKGKTHSEETKRKISENKKGKKLSKEHIEKSANARRGKKHTEEHKIKIGMANKGKIRSEKQKENLRIKNLGKKHSEETKRKMRESKIGDNNCNRKKVVNIETGEVYNSVIDCMEKTSYKKLYQKLSGERKNTTPFKYL